ncbi:MAG: NAD(P)/FAD-dependent oxidoreductase [Minwuia sp.]|uniref:NAD(P)/FAD-dependent oxidoreductase n=1 Tax=Minwuia sp. TaxID=2493630 RepID=UPI003A89EB0C
MSRIAAGRLKVADDLSTDPWWWQARQRHALPEPAVPDKVEFAIIGAGYTGLSAALTLAQSGASVLVLDSADPGDGASSRNGGMVGDRLKPGFPALAKEFGETQAIALMEEAAASVDFVERLIIDNGIDCDFGRMGRYYPAVTPGHFESMKKKLEAEQGHREVQATMIGPEEQSQFLNTPLYCGGRLHHDTGGLHPAKFHDGLLAAARNAGATVAGRTPVLSLEENDDGFVMDTGLGFVEARKVLVCTNGYTGPELPDFRSRVIPVTSAIVATEELDPGLVERLIPGGRMISDSYHLLNYYRPSPDGRRILLGSRPGLGVGSPQKLAAYLGGRLGRIFPELDGARITHCWSGKVAFSFDTFPKIGMAGRIGYAMCYGGSGVAMSNWLGHKLAQKAMEDLAGRTAFDDMDFPSPFYYQGWPWFLGPLLSWYGLQDRLTGSRPRR